MNRIYDPIRDRSNYRFHFIFGPGTNDFFISNNLGQENIIEALNSVLLSQNFDRIIHISPTNVARCIDDQSRSNSANVLWPKREVVLQEGFVEGITTGPLGSASGRSFPNQSNGLNAGLGDIHGLRLVDTLMNDNREYRTACVIFDANTFCDHFDSQRILFSIFNQWLLLPGENLNECFFIVPIADKESFIEQIKGTRLSQFLKITSGDKNIIEIEFPNEFELTNIFYPNFYDATHIPGEARKLIRMCLRERTTLRSWKQRLDSVDHPDVTIFRQLGWLRSSGDDPRTVNEKLENFVGLGEVREFVRLIQGLADFYTQTQQPISTTSFHMVFFGSPGTGKTSIARLFGQIFQETGLLKVGHLTEVKGSDLIADHVGGTGTLVSKIIDRALDGILFIDEAYSLSENERGGFGREAIEVILKQMDDERDRLVVILAGYKDSMQQFFKVNPGLERRFPLANRIEFPDFSLAELGKIFDQYLEEKQLYRDDQTKLILEQVIKSIYQKRGKNFGNAGEMRNLAESIELRVKARSSTEQNQDLWISKEDIPDVYLPTVIENNASIEEILSPLDNFVGMDHIKQHIISLAKLKILDGLKNDRSTLLRAQYLDHFLFLGNPGTGKTTTARLVSEVLQRLGILKTGNLVEVSAVDLIAGYVGQTPERTRKIVESAIDGVLFIDEAYSLFQKRGGIQDGYGREAIDTLVKLIDQYRNRFVVIMAGYPDEMIEMVHSNPGLSSRFTKTIYFPDYSEDQLGEILLGICEHEGYSLPDEVLSQALDILNQVKMLSPRSFGNAREVQRLFRHMMQNLANRIITNPMTDLGKIQLPNGWNIFSLQDLAGFDVIVDQRPSLSENYPYDIEIKNPNNRS